MDDKFDNQSSHGGFKHIPSPEPELMSQGHYKHSIGVGEVLSGIIGVLVAALVVTLIFEIITTTP